jgi:hypothetical protein
MRSCDAEFLVLILLFKIRSREFVSIFFDIGKRALMVTVFPIIPIISRYFPAYWQISKKRLTKGQCYILLFYKGTIVMVV